MIPKYEDYVIMKFSEKSWVYLTHYERKHIELIIKALLKKNKQGLVELTKSTNISHNSIWSPIYTLVTLRCLRVQQKGKNKIISINRDWEQKLKKHTFIRNFGEKLNPHDFNQINLNGGSYDKKGREQQAQLKEI